MNLNPPDLSSKQVNSGQRAQDTSSQSVKQAGTHKSGKKAINCQMQNSNKQSIKQSIKSTITPKYPSQTPRLDTLPVSHSLPTKGTYLTLSTRGQTPACFFPPCQTDPARRLGCGISTVARHAPFALFASRRDIYTIPMRVSSLRVPVVRVTEHQDAAQKG